MRRSRGPRRPTRCSDSATSSERSESTCRCSRTCSSPTAMPTTSVWRSSSGYGRGAVVQSRRHDPRRDRGSTAYHPVHGQPPRGPDDHRARLHLGTRPRRRAPAAAQGRTPRRGAQRRGGRTRAGRLRDRRLGPPRDDHRRGERAGHAQRRLARSSSMTTPCASAARRATSVRHRSHSPSPTARRPTTPRRAPASIVIPIDVRSDREPAAVVRRAVSSTSSRVNRRPSTSSSSPGTPIPTRPNELEYRVLPPPADGFDVSLDGDEMTITRDDRHPDRHACVGRRSTSPTRAARGAATASSCASCRRPSRSRARLPMSPSSTAGPRRRSTCSPTTRPPTPSPTRRCASSARCAASRPAHCLAG